MSKSFIGVIAAIILVFAGIVIFSSDKASGPSTTNSNAKPTEHVLGEGSVTLTEYGDFGCSACYQYFPTLQAVKEQFKGQVKFQFRNFPLQSLHPNAFAAARAAEAAHLQGKFWEMHDTLYNPAVWQIWSESKNPNPEFEKYAKQLGLDVAKFKTDFASSRVNNVVNADVAAGNKLDITATPTFLIDGKKLEPSPGNSVAEFEKVIKAAIANKKAE